MARGEALRDAIPDYYAQAVREHDVDVIAAPEIEITEGEDTGPVAFDAVVEVRPIVTVPGYDSLRVTIARPEATDEEIDAQIDRMRRQYAELETVEREAAEGDIVTIDVNGSQAGEPLEGLTAEDYSYEVGSAAIVPELDEVLVGASAGDELSFDADHPDPDERRACTSRSPSRRSASGCCPRPPTSGRPRRPSSTPWPSCGPTWPSA